MFTYKYINNKGVEGTIQTDLQLGSIIVIRDFGPYYTHYTNAYKLFNSKRIVDGVLVARHVDDYSKFSAIKIWQVVAIGVHERDNRILYLLRGKNGAEIVYGSKISKSGREHCYSEIPLLTYFHSKKYYKTNKNYIVRQVCKL